MKVILILLSPAFGHYHATYKLATQLKARGYRVVYGGEDSFRQSVESQGFELKVFSFASLARDRYWKLRYFSKEVVRFFLKGLFKGDRHKVYQAYVEASNEAKKVIKALRPDVILLDSHISPLYLLLIQTHVPCLQICTTLSTRSAAMIPPINSGFIPRGRAFDKWLVALVWLKLRMESKLDYVFQKVVYVGKDNNSMLRRFARENGIQPRKVVEGKSLPSVATLVTAPLEFDYPWRPSVEAVYHIGPSVLLERNDAPDDFTLPLLERLEKLKKTTSTKLILCSLGTINYWQNRYCEQFFKKVIEAFKDRNDWFVIMAIGNDIPVAKLGDIPDNFAVYKVVPQIKVLPFCEAMITHGGFNTVKECIMAGVPMLVYPLSTIWDQQGNAARAVYHGIGLRGELAMDPSDMIFSKVKMLCDDRGFKARIASMSDVFQKANESLLGVHVIERHLSTSPAVVSQEQIEPVEVFS